jgi:hypothetical protein
MSSYKEFLVTSSNSRIIAIVEGYIVSMVASMVSNVT